jgi:putative oxidoreductase
MSTIPASRLNAALALLRVVVGLTFVAHGTQKLFVVGLAGVTGAFGGMGVPLPGLTGPAVTFLECFGGLALAAGFLTRPVAVALALDMLGAMTLVHLKNGFFLPKGAEFALLLFSAALALALAGAGDYSVDRVLAARRVRA